jgi:hypothetical protein
MVDDLLLFSSFPSFLARRSRISLKEIFTTTTTTDRHTLSYPWHALALARVHSLLLLLPVLLAVSRNQSRSSP